jgi:hypothetical protein
MEAWAAVIPRRMEKIQSRASLRMRLPRQIADGAGTSLKAAERLALDGEDCRLLVGSLRGCSREGRAFGGSDRELRVRGPESGF